MKKAVFSPAFLENRSKTLGLSSLIAIVFHGLFLLTIGLTVPVISFDIESERSIDIDLTTLDTMSEKTEKPVAQAREKNPISSEPLRSLPPAENKAAESKPSPSPKKKQQKTAQRKKTVISNAPATASDNHSSHASVLPENSRKSSVPDKVRASSEDFSGPPPVYPELARKRKQEGTVNVRCAIDSSGAVRNTTIAKSSGFRLLDEAALKAVSKWKYRHSRADKKNPDSIIVPVKFILK